MTNYILLITGSLFIGISQSNLPLYGFNASFLVIGVITLVYSIIWDM